MDYKDFTKRDKAFKGFIEYRKEVLNSGADFPNVFVDLCTKAIEGDCIAQDCVAYFFNKGVPDYLVQNYEYYLSWQILAGANGNEFALEKLEFFLNSGLQEIINDEEILKTAMLRRNLTKENAVFVITNLICEGIVDELKINPKDLIDIKSKPSRYSPEKNRAFLSAMERCLQNVVDFLVS
ncbi:MAG: hypothetical protein E7375_00305 [Clostridiales bacterium]|nr:hypothetical protein [Clostridiales bacterium]